MGSLVKLAVAIGLFVLALWIMLRPLLALASPLKPALTFVFGLLLKITELLISGVLLGVRALAELNRR